MPSCPLCPRLTGERQATTPPASSMSACRASMSPWLSAMPDAPGLAVGIETLLALDTEPCLGRARLVVEPGVNHLAVARAGSSADGVLGLEHQDLAAAPRQGPRDREANHSGADDDTIDFFRHRFLRMTA